MRAGLKAVWQDQVWSRVIAAVIVATLGLVVSALTWGTERILHVVASHWEAAWLAALTVAGLVLWVRLSRLGQRLATGFVDDFSGDLGRKWDFVGAWEIINRELVVTGSDAGGITRTGALWENYTLSFEARIMNRCLGVIVRAQDLNNYYMLQINTDRIRPHRRVAVPLILAGTAPGASPGGISHQIGYQVGWQVFDDKSVPLTGKTLDQWFSVKVSVHGRALEMEIDPECNGEWLKVFCERSFVEHATGRVGFRNDGPEKALVRNVRVSLER